MQKKKKVLFLTDRNDAYSRILEDTIIEEVKDNCQNLDLEYVTSLWSILNSDNIVICGSGDIPKKLQPLFFLKKRIFLYHVPSDTAIFGKFEKRADLIVTPKNNNGYTSYPSPVLISDFDTPKHIEKIWRKEKLSSKRGCIGVLGLNLGDDLRQKLIDALNLLVEDLDLNLIFIPLLREESGRDVFSNIKYSANAKYIEVNQYSSKELLGIIGRIDVILTSSEKGIVCSMAVDKPVITLAVDDSLRQFLNGVSEENAILDIGKLSSDELYSRMKIAWVHRDSIAGQIQKKTAELKKKAAEGIGRLCREISKGERAG